MRYHRDPDIYDYCLKIALVGDSYKQQFLECLLTGKLSPNSPPISTISTDWRISIGDTVVKCCIVNPKQWKYDSCERLSHPTPLFYRGTDGILVTFAAHSQRSLDYAETLITEARTIVLGNAPTVMVGVHREEGTVWRVEERAKSLDARLVFTNFKDSGSAVEAMRLVATDCVTAIRLKAEGSVAAWQSNLSWWRR